MQKQTFSAEPYVKGQSSENTQQQDPENLNSIFTLVHSFPKQWIQAILDVFSCPSQKEMRTTLDNQNSHHDHELKEDTEKNLAFSQQECFKPTKTSRYSPSPPLPDLRHLLL